MYVQNLGDGSLSFVFGNRISRDTSEGILSLYRKLKGNPILERLSVFDLVPAYCSLTFHFNPLETDSHSVEKALWPFIATEASLSGSLSEQQENVILPVIYKGIDLERVSALTGLSVGEVIKRHSDSIYHVAMIGFKPHFPYLIGLDKSLETDRLDSPRVRVPAGSVAIGGAQTGIYPEESPGGWNIIGETDPRLLRELHPGDSVSFEEVSRL